MTQSIGDKIIAAIEANDMVLTREEDYLGRKFIWHPSAAEQLEAVVEAHIEERVRIRLGIEHAVLISDNARLQEQVRYWSTYR